MAWQAGRQQCSTQGCPPPPHTHPRLQPSAPPPGPQAHPTLPLLVSAGLETTVRVWSPTAAEAQPVPAAAELRRRQRDGRLGQPTSMLHMLFSSFDMLANALGGEA